MLLISRGSAAPRSRRRILALVALLAALVTVGPALSPVLGAGESAWAAAGRRPVVTFKAASFNVLGSNHTFGSRYWSPGKVRARRAKAWLGAEGVSIAGLQESQVDQARVLTRGRAWASFPDPRRSVNTETAQSVAWRRDTWRFVKAHSFRIPFDVTQVRKQPVVQLRHRGTGRRVWVISVHFTAGGGAHGAHERRVGTGRLIRKVNGLRRTNVPVLVTGDMNAHGDFFCPTVNYTNLHAASGGGISRGRCQVPSPMRVDWLMGSPRLRFEDFRFADGGVLDQITDHTVPVARVSLR